MNCPFCGHSKTEVRSNRTKGAASIRQRRCTYCDKVFDTEEMPLVSRYQIVKKNGSREEWSMDKFLLSLQLPFSLKDRELYNYRLRKIVEAADAGLRASTDRQRPSSWLGELAIRRLAGISDIASFRYATVFYGYTLLEAREMVGAMATPALHYFEHDLTDGL